jgi:hypothetical protein
MINETTSQLTLVLLPTTDEQSSSWGTCWQNLLVKRTYFPGVDVDWIALY